MKQILWAVVILLLASMYFAPILVETYDLHEMHVLRMQMIKDMPLDSDEGQHL